MILHIEINLKSFKLVEKIDFTYICDWFQIQFVQSDSMECGWWLLGRVMFGCSNER